MAQNRESKMDQAEVYAEQLAQRYSSYYRQLAQNLAPKPTPAPVLSPPPPAPVYSPPAPPIAQRTATRSFNEIPGETVTVSYNLAGMGDALQNNGGMILLGAMALGALALNRKR